MASAILMYFANRRSATFCAEYVGTRGQDKMSWRPNASERPPAPRKPRNMRPRVLDRFAARNGPGPSSDRRRSAHGQDLAARSLPPDDKGPLQGPPSSL